MDLRARCMQFLYTWVTQGKLSNIRKNQVEELELLILQILAEKEAQRSAEAMQAQVAKESSDA